jgi:hypothetical protein
MNEQEEKNLIASEAEVLTSCYGVLAGLTFTASILIFSFRNTIPLFGDLFLTLSLIATVFFIYSVALSSSASSVLRKYTTREAKRYLSLADDFGVVAFIVMLCEITL